MFIKSPTGFLEIIGIDFESFVKTLVLVEALKYAWRKFQIPLKTKNLYYQMKIFKCNFLITYEDWRISRKCGYDSHAMTKIQMSYLCERIVTEMALDPESFTRDGIEIFARLLHQTHPKIFKEIFGESIPEIQARLNIEKFFHNVFA